MSSLLIVDDYEPVRRGIRSLLRCRLDWQICGEATNGRDAVEMAKRLRPDCILMDISMPRLNGFEATRLIREELPETRVVIISQNDPSVVRLEAEEAGASGFVAKSELHRALLPTIEAVLASPCPPQRLRGDFSSVVAAPEQKSFEFLSGGGETGELIRSMNWAETAIGPIESWSPTLRMMVSFLLVNRFPLLLWWGPKYCQLYNDAYRPVLGTKHPHSMGQQSSECFAEIWHIIGPLVDTPFRGGQATWMEDLPLEFNRYGFLEETHFTVAYSPVPDQTAPGGIGGVLATVHEISEKVVGQRRVAILRDLSAQTSEAKTAEASCVLAAEALQKYPKDVPFGLFYLIDSDRKCARLAAACGVEPGDSACPTVIDLEKEDSAEVWPLRKVARNGELELIDRLGERLEKVPPGPWTDPPHSAAVIPIRSNNVRELAGFLIAGISVRLRFDEQYRSFFDLLGTQVATAIANARAYEEERKRAEALAEIDRAKTVFFSNISHEFRTPLTLMLGPLEDTLNASDARLSPHDREHLTMVHRNSLRLLRLVNSLLDFSRIEAGRIEAVYQPTDICGFASEIASSFRSAMERAGLDYEIKCERVAEPIYLDRDMWEKIVLNLLSNAFKFTLHGKVSVSVQLSDNSIHVEVSDTGIGIAEQDLPRLFERFHRIEGARGRTYEGTGIGLALVQELVKFQGGAVEVRSAVGAGTTFTVSIPRGKAHLPQDRIKETRTLVSSATRADSYVEEALRWLPGAPEEVEPVTFEPGVSSITDVSDGLESRGTHVQRPLIVVADDNADMAGYLSRLLRGLYRVRVASNGVEALRAVRELNPDLILTDIMMPGLDGLGFLREIRNDPAMAGKPVIVLSARAGDEARIDGLRAGADDYIVKPFNARELRARVSSALTLAKVRGEAADKLEEEVWMRTQELEHRNAEVLEQTEQLRELSARLLNAQDEERRRIARELHDSAGQTLTVLSLNLSQVATATKHKSPEAAQAIEDSQHLVNQLSQEIRTLSYLLHPPLLDEMGLSSALRWYVDGLHERSGITIHLEVSADPNRLSRDMQLAIFRIVQECLTNIHRHSGSKTARIRIDGNSDVLFVEVQDRGKGIDPDKLVRIKSSGSGVGIRGMGERIRHFGGILEIESTAEGTKVSVKFPLAKSTAASANLSDAMAAGAD